MGSYGKIDDRPCTPLLLTVISVWGHRPPRPRLAIFPRNCLC